MSLPRPPSFQSKNFGSHDRIRALVRAMMRGPVDEDRDVTKECAGGQGIHDHG